MMSSNLPPGVTESMLPGNRPEDMSWERFHEWLDAEIEGNNLSLDDAYIIWRMGLTAYKTARDWGARFPHDPENEYEGVIHGPFSARQIDALWRIRDALREERFALAVLDRSMNDVRCDTGHVALLTKDYQNHRAQTDEALSAFDALSARRDI